MLAATAEQPSMLPTILMFVALGAVMYFFMIRPQQKKQKEINNFRNSLTVGQTVVTIGGLHGTIKTMDDTTVTLHVATGVCPVTCLPMLGSLRSMLCPKINHRVLHIE